MSRVAINRFDCIAYELLPFLVNALMFVVCNWIVATVLLQLHPQFHKFHTKFLISQALHVPTFEIGKFSELKFKRELYW